MSTAILIAIQLVIAFGLGRGGVTETNVWMAALFAAVGTLAIGALNADHVIYPRSAFRGVAGILAAGILVSPWTAGSPEQWALEARSYLWLLPWNLVLLSTMPARQPKACTHGHRTGWFMMGAALLLVVLLQIQGIVRLLGGSGW